MTNTGNPWTNKQQDASYKYIWCQSKVSDLANQILPLMIKKLKTGTLLVKSFILHIMFCQKQNSGEKVITFQNLKIDL